MPYEKNKRKENNLVSQHSASVERLTRNSLQIMMET